MDANLKRDGLATPPAGENAVEAGVGAAVSLADNDAVSPSDSATVSTSRSSPPSHKTAAPQRTLLDSAVRTWLRFIVPLTLLSALALSPVIALALRAPAPVDLAGANALLVLCWELIALAWPCQLVLVGAAAAMIGSRSSQRQAFRSGLSGLGHAFVPSIVAIAAIATASLALVVPGLVMLVLLALTGASTRRGLPAQLVDSIAVARKHLRAVALVVAAMVALDIAIGVIAQRAFVAPLPTHPSPAQLLAFRHLVRAAALALVVLSPLPATLLAAIRSRAEP